MNFKYAACDWCMPLRGLGAISIAAEAGFDGIQLEDLGGASEGFPLNDSWLQKAYKDAAKKENIELQTLNLRSLSKGGLTIQPLNTTLGDLAIKSIDNGIRACVKMGIPVVFLSSFFQSFINNDYQFDNYAKLASYANQVAKDNGITLVFESVLPLERFSKMLDAIGPGVKILYDTLNPIVYRSGEPKLEIQAFGKDKINQFHVKDMAPNYQDFCLLGEGVGDYHNSVNVIRSIGWSGWVVNESYHHLMKYRDGRGFIELLKADLVVMRKSFEGSDNSMP